MAVIGELGLLAITLCAWSQGGLPYEQDGNAFLVRLRDGSIEIEWVSSSTFRFCRWWGRQPAVKTPVRREAQEVKVREVEGGLEFATRYIRVTLEAASGRVTVRDAEGKTLLADATAPRHSHGVAVLEREKRAGELFRGLGVQSGLDGTPEPAPRVQTDRPFLISSLGYGEYFPSAGQYVYEFGERRRVTTAAQGRLEYFFYYGPTPKEILEEHVTAAGGIKELDWRDFRVTTRLPPGALTLPATALSWEGIAEMLRQVMRASYSAILLPAVDAAAYRDAPAPIRKRAVQLMAFLPVIHNSSSREAFNELSWLVRQRDHLAPFLVSYSYEAQERGFPLVRPPAMQYPKDEEAAKHEDQFFLGDELLIAPILKPEAKRRVYLPMGSWTEWHTNRRHAGRQVVEVEVVPDCIPVFARNGSIVPWGPEGPDGKVALHYFPRLAAEFFLYEEGSGALTQLHAAPAGDLLRLEIESARRRSYEWVVHHIARCRKVAAGDQEYEEVASRNQLGAGRWWYDGKRENLHIQTRAAAGAPHVIYIAF